MTQLLCNVVITRFVHRGGYVVRARVIEFWQGQTRRLHDRIRFRLAEDADSDSAKLSPELTSVGSNGWVFERLAP